MNQTSDPEEVFQSAHVKSFRRKDHGTRHPEKFGMIKEFLEATQPLLVCGDTDSIFLDPIVHESEVKVMKANVEEGLQVMCTKIAEEMIMQPPTMQLGIYEDNFDKTVVKHLTRQNSSRFIGKFFSDVVNLLIQDKSLLDVLELVLGHMDSICHNCVDPDDLAVTKKYKAGSINGNFQTFCRALRARGVVIHNNDPITYVVVRAQASTPLSERMRLLEEFCQTEGEVLDSMHYLECTDRPDAMIMTKFGNQLRQSKNLKLLPGGGICQGICDALKNGHSWENIAAEVRAIAEEQSS